MWTTSVRDNSKDTNILDAVSSTENEMEEDDWSIEMAQVSVMDLTSLCEVNSFPIINQQHMDQSNAFNSMSKSHLDCGNESDFSDNSANASEQSQDEPLISTRRRINAVIVEDSDDEMYDGYPLTDSRDLSLDSITTLVNRSPNQTPTISNAVSDSSLELSPLGLKNLAKLTDPKTGDIVEPPEKRCQKCREWMDWRTNGQIRKQRNGRYTYQGCCNGDCQREKFNEQINAKVRFPTIPPLFPMTSPHQLIASFTHLLQLVRIWRRILAVISFLLILTS